MNTNNKSNWKHVNREDLTGEHALGDIGQIILLLIFLTAWITDSFIIKYSAFITDYIPLYIKIPLGVIVIFSSGYLAMSGLRIVFGETREPSMVIRKGVFNKVRHPIYLGSLLFYIGLLVFSFSIGAAVILVVIISFYIAISRHEEKLLLQKFGKEYEDYMKEVPMLIPRIYPKHIYSSKKTS
jgi:protein-S-isoprenylcysteine O-methyltransferase Ste14